jgi:hypothetical protein
MTLTDLTRMLLILNSIVDRGEHAGVSIAEVETAIERGDLFPWLRKRFAAEPPDGVGITLAIYEGPDSKERAQQALRDYLDRFPYMGLQGILRRDRGQERSKWGIGHNGVCLLMSWVADLMKHAT